MFSNGSVANWKNSQPINLTTFLITETIDIKKQFILISIIVCFANFSTIERRTFAHKPFHKNRFSAKTSHSILITSRNYLLPLEP